MADLERKFAENLKYFRKQLMFTQKELAGQLNCSEKAVSKWECGTSIPDIQLLLALSRALHTDVETLFADRETMYLLGIDGGGTKTKLKLCDLSGNYIKELCTDGCNPMDIGAVRAQEILRSAIYEICAGIPLSRVTVFAGLAGGISGNMKAMFASFFETFRFYASENDSDNKNIIAAGLGDADGITLILGTGICSFRQQGKQHFMVGGKGYLIDAGGSAYHLGRDALHAYFCEKDGMGPKTQITEEIDSLGNRSVPTLMQEIYAEGKKYIASYAKTVYAAIRKDDAVAAAILRKNMREAALLIETQAAHLTQNLIPVVISGGLTKDPLTIDYLKSELHAPERFEIRILEKDPVDGAVMLAKKRYQEKQEEA